MNLEKITWWVFWLSQGIIMLFLHYGWTFLIISTLIVELIYLLGLFLFLIFGNKLILGYGWIFYILDTIISTKEITGKNINKFKLKSQENTLSPEKKQEDLPFKNRIMILFKDLDYYKYACYGVFLLTLITLLTLFNLLDQFNIRKYLLCIFWGGVTIKFFFWGLEQLSKISIVEYNLLNFEKLNTNGG